MVLAILLVAALDRTALRSRVLLPSRVDMKVDIPMRRVPPPPPAAAPAPAAPSKESTAPTKSVRRESPSDPWSYFHPNWVEDYQPTIGNLNVRSPLTHAAMSLVYLLSDPKQRIEPEFRVPPAMRERVLFWMHVHARYDTHMRVLHDRVRPWIIYGYADFTSVYQASETRAQGDAKAFRLEREVVKALKARIAEAAGLTPTSLLSTWEKVQLRQMLSATGSLSADGAVRLMEGIRCQTGQRDEFLAALDRSERLLPYIEMELRLHQLPAALGRIPFVESSFNWRAHSKVGAMGIWQFMPETARQMIGGNPLQWADPLRQTRGAVRLFKIFRSMLPDWSTAITSYNSGAGRLKHLVTKYRTKSIVKLLDVSDGSSLGFAGKNFYAQFLSVSLMEAYKDEVFPEIAHRKDEDLLAFDKVLTFPQEFERVY